MVKAEKDERDVEKRQYSPITQEKIKSVGISDENVVLGHNDFMNTVFKEKRHRAYDAIIR